MNTKWAGNQDPPSAYQLLKMMSNRVRRLDAEIAQLKVNQRFAEKDIQTPFANPAYLS